MKSRGILDVFPVFHTEKMSLKIRPQPKTIDSEFPYTSNDPGGVSCPSTAAWYRWDLPIPRTRAFTARIRSYYTKSEEKSKGGVGRDGKIVSAASKLTIRLSAFHSKTIKWNLSGRQNESFRASAHTGVGISIKIRIIYRHTDCSNPPFSGIHPQEIVLLFRRLPHQESGLVRNDREFDKFPISRSAYYSR